MKQTKKVSRPESETPVAPPPSREQVAALAHAIWIDRGCPVGQDLEHWLEAERQLGSIRREEGGFDPDTAESARVDRELDRIVSPPGQRGPTSL